MLSRYSIRQSKSLAPHRSAFAGTALSVAYGLQMVKGDNRYLDPMRDMIHTAANFAVPGKYLVEAIPALQYVPQWFPGAAFKREAAAAEKRFKVILRQLVDAGIGLRQQWAGRSWCVGRQLA